MNSATWYARMWFRTHLVVGTRNLIEMFDGADVANQKNPLPYGGLSVVAPLTFFEPDFA